MALGGGTWVTQNKVLPGTYENFVSLASASAKLSDRGVCTIALELDWGPEDEVFTVQKEDFEKHSLYIFGYPYTHEKLKGLRDLFINAVTLHAYRVNGGGEKASNDFATAKYSGIRGNDIKIAIAADVDNPSAYIVSTYVDTNKVDAQTVTASSELEDNDFVTFKSGVELKETASTPLSGGTNGTADGLAHQNYLDKIESYTYNTMGCAVEDEATKKLYLSFNKRIRDSVGMKHQLVGYNLQNADYLGAISVKNAVTDEGWSPASLVFWVTGAESGCPVNESLQNDAYTGEFNVSSDYTQEELKVAITSGEFTLHKVNGVIKVLDDINTKVSTSDTEGEDFKDNQVIRVIDQIANDDAVLFGDKYLGKVPNDQAGRTALWSDLVKIRKDLQKIRAIEDFNDADLTVAQGDTKKSVVVNNTIKVVCAMSKLYVETTVA